MDFSVEFYETAAGACPVREFLEELKDSDPDDFAAILAGLAKLRNRQYHREPLSKALGDGLFVRTPTRLAEKRSVMGKTNFDQYLAEQLQDSAFASRFAHAGEAWDVALQITSLRQQAGLSQKDLAKLLKTSQQQISRLESPAYAGHSLSTLRRVAEALHAKVRIVFEPEADGEQSQVAENSGSYGGESKKA